MASSGRPRVLFVYFTYTQQTLKVIELMADVLRERGCDVQLAAIKFTDKRWADRFTRFPLRHAYLDIFGMLPAQVRRATGEISVPDEVKGEYDLICFGSPTWWLTTNLPIRSFLESDAASPLLSGKSFTAIVVCRRYWRGNMNFVRKLGTKAGGTWIDGIHFKAAGGQVRSLLSLISYLGKGENRKQYLGVPIPPANLQPSYTDEAKAFAGQLVKQLPVSQGGHS